MTASFDRWNDWKASYRYVLGFDDSYNDNEDTEEMMEAEKPTKFRRLLYIGPDIKSSSDSSDVSHQDPWLYTAQELYDSICHTSRWMLEQKQLLEVDGATAAEATLVQSTLTSFTATTAQELEQLRLLLQKEGNELGPQVQQHRQGMVQHLVALLQEALATPFKQRQHWQHRRAVRVWRQPVECIVSPESKPFLPTRPSHKLQARFAGRYEETAVLVPLRPESQLFPETKEAAIPSSTTQSLKQTKQQEEAAALQRQQQLRQQQAQQAAAQEAAQSEQEQQELLLQEQQTLLLQQQHDSDLAGVQQLEESMVQITTLLSQFGQLVADQHEDVSHIQEQTVQAKENIEKGQEALIKAKDRTVQSNHTMAKSIVVLAWIVLFFHWLRD